MRGRVYVGMSIFHFAAVKARLYARRRKVGHGRSSYIYGYIMPTTQCINIHTFRIDILEFASWPLISMVSLKLAL